MIEVRDLVKRYGGQTVLDRVSLVVPKDSITSLVGPSGEGKSVLLRLMIGLETPDSGEILIDGENIVGMRMNVLNRIRRRCGVLFQDAALFDYLSVGENVAFPIREHKKLTEKEIQDIVLEKLAEVGLLGEEDKKPAQLSGGMRKRVGLARALALDPELVFFDEPTSGLDPVTGAYITNLIIKTHWERPVTYVVVSHDVKKVLEISDEVMMLYRGKIIARGTPDEIGSDPDHVIQRFMDGSFGGPMPVR
jgi:phospholipid/cholesterol/gamma-HCH transport system ATP-binding protein